MTSKSYKIVEWNSNGLKNKTPELTHYLQTNDIDIALITETKLNNTDKINIKDYETYRKDRPTHGGGVAIIVKKSVNHILIQNLNTNLELLGIKITGNIHIFVLYINPNYTITHKNLNDIFDGRNKALIAGDLNARHVTWKNHINNTNGTNIYNYYLTNNINIHHSEQPTHYPPNGATPTYIDIVLNKNVNEMTELETDSALSSDHNPIKFQIKTKRTDDEPDTTTRKSFKHTNWTKFREDLDRHIKINNKIDTTEQLEEEVIKLTQNLQKTIDRHTKDIKLGTLKIELPDNITKQIKQKNETRKEWQRTRNPQTKTLLNQQTRQIKDALTELYNQNFSNKLQQTNNNIQKLWKLTKMIKRPTQTIPTLQQNGQEYMTNKEKSNILAVNYAKIQSNDAFSQIEQQINDAIAPTIQRTHDITSDELESLLTNPTEVKNLIRRLPNNKAPGPDDIPNLVLKNLTKKTIVQLTYIINATLKLQYFPNYWKNAVVIPIHKKDKNKNDPLSYRPISLLNTMAKLTEKIIHRRLTDYNETKDIIKKEQFGFRRGHSTEMQLIRIITDTIQNFNREKLTVMTLLDVQKAFDTVWINGLIYKMIKLQIPKHLTRLIYSYLTDRTIQVKIKNDISDKQKTKAGVPQGSILGPTLFNYFVNDIPTFEKTKIAMYADDTATYAHSYYAQAATLQNQIHINKIQKYCDEWKIKLNADKTETITFTRKFTNTRSIQRLKVADKTIEPTKTVKYLGVWLDSALKFHVHTQKVISKFNASLRTFYPLLNKNSKLNQFNKKLIYTSIIRPLITYAAPILAMTSRTQKTKLQRLQNKCLRLILTADRYTRVDELHRQTDITTLTEHIDKLTRLFYQNSIPNSPLTSNIPNLNEQLHKLPYQYLNLPLR